MLGNRVSDAIRNQRWTPVRLFKSQAVFHRSPARQCSSIACCIFVIVLAMLSAASLSAQSYGTISGHVADATGAAFPDTTITLSNQATGAVRTTVSTSSGDYTFPAVSPGNYSIRAERSGFKTASSQNVHVQVSQALRQDFTLEVGTVTQSVTVSGTSDLLQQENSSLGTVVPTQTINEMPLNNRNYLGLVAVSANTNTLSPTQGQAGSREGGARANESISVGGQRIMYDHYTLDGVNNTDVDFNSFVVQPTVDAIQEMKVQTGVYPAEYGYNATQVNVVTTSGSNTYHGTAFDFIRNNYADALGYDYTTKPLLPVPFKYNDYGFVLDGPIRIPRVFNGKDRFFFMVNDEWYSSIRTSSSLTTLPTAAMLAGDFSQYPYNHLRSRDREPRWHGQDAVLVQRHVERDLSEPDRSHLGQIRQIVLRPGADIRSLKQLPIPHQRQGHSRRL